MNATRLPASYVPVKKVDFQQDVKVAVFVHAGSLVLIVLMILIGCLFVPLRAVFSSIFAMLCNSLTALVGITIYGLFAVWIPGLFMKKFSGIKPEYGFSGLYVYSKCNAFFDKKSYLICILSPIVLWGVALSLICCFVPSWLFWGVYLLLALNIASALTQLCSTFVICRMPKEVLVYDFGTTLFLYLPRDKIQKDS